MTTSIVSDLQRARDRIDACRRDVDAARERADSQRGCAESRLIIRVLDSLIERVDRGEALDAPTWLNDPNIPDLIKRIVRESQRRHHQATKDATARFERHSPMWSKYVTNKAHETQRILVKLRDSNANRIADVIAQATKESLQRLDEAERDYADMVARARDAYVADLGADYLSVRECDYAHSDDPASLDELDTLRTAFVRQWCSRTLNMTFDDEQAAAIGSTSQHTLVAARAGSGKTRVVVARAAFLVRHCRVAGSQLLIVTFNKAAATEVRNRLAIHGVECPHVMTFHALANRIVHPEENLILDDPKGHRQELSNLVQRIVYELLDRDDPAVDLCSIMMQHFEEDWTTLLETGLGLSWRDGLLLRRSLKHEALDGTYVKSFGEKVIANFLFEHDIEYRYEPSHRWEGRNYRPDFELAGRKIVIEYFGMQGDAEYDAGIANKRQYWNRRAGWELLEYTPRPLRESGESALREQLASDLRQLGIPLRRLTDDAIWQRIRDRCVTRFAGLMADLVGRARQAMLTPQLLAERIRGHSTLSNCERDVLGVVSDIFGEYLSRLSTERREDFDGLMARAGDMVRAGRTAFHGKDGSGDVAQFRFIMIDEYQDLSPLFDSLVQAIRGCGHSDAACFGVGDDWQAINRFAGSDLRFFSQFEEFFSPAQHRSISTNYRSAESIVGFGNQVMEGRGRAARWRQGAAHGMVELVDLQKFNPNVPEWMVWRGDVIIPAVRRLVYRPLQNKQTVAVLARQHKLPYTVASAGPRTGTTDLERLSDSIREGMPSSWRERFHVGTVHQYKGRESDVVILIDCVQRWWPLLHPYWVYSRVFGVELEDVVEDERRLFYVACSRASERLVLVTDSLCMSPFLEPLQLMCNASSVPVLPSWCPSEDDLFVELSNGPCGRDPTIARREVLRRCGFTFVPGPEPVWAKKLVGMPPVTTYIETLPEEPWFEGPDGLVIRVLRGDGTPVVSRVLSEGKLCSE